jgi:hypothetical protein
MKHVENWWSVPTINFGGLYIEADYGHIHLNKAKVAEVIGERA